MYNICAKTNNLTKYKSRIFIKDTLEIETYIIGYQIQGEAILFFIRADKGITFSGLIDCYRNSKTDKIKGIMEENNVDKLNFLCWTHPDYDHSNGMEEILGTYVDDKTVIWIPEGVEEGEIQCSTNVRKLFAHLRQCVLDERANYNVYSASDKKDLMYYNSVCFQKDMDYFPLEILSYAPNSKIIRKQMYLDKYIKNDRSIFFTLALGDVRIFLTGDIEDETISRIPTCFLDEHIHIMKIPHHGSSSSTKVLEWGEGKCDVACSTVYRNGKQNLPVSEVMEQYRKQAQLLFCTGQREMENEVVDYGVVKIVTNVLERTFETFVEGNAGIWKTVTS